MMNLKDDVEYSNHWFGLKFVVMLVYNLSSSSD